MRYSVLMTDEAEAEIDNIFRHIARDKPNAAGRFVERLRNQILALDQSPRRCPVAPEDGIEGLHIRHLIHRPYRVIFAIDGKTVVILRVRHGARRPIEEF